MAFVSECKRCGARITGRRDKIYCSDACRFADWREGKTSAEANLCIYCGLPADSLDHIPPQSVRPTLVKMGIASRFPFREVWACRECNSLLGYRELWTIELRKRFIKKALRKKYRRYLRIPHWDDREISELGYALQQHVLQGTVIREILEYRLKW